ncbi:MAG: hypothetical protein RLZZ301_957 [Bacteroidota bacterium]|jgi:hypothetical protein
MIIRNILLFLGLAFSINFYAQAPYIATSQGIGQYGYLEKDASTWMRLNSNTYGNIYQLFTRTYLNSQNILTYPSVAPNACTSGEWSTTNYNFGANAIAGYMAYTSVHAQYCNGGGNSYSNNDPNQIGFNQRQQMIFDLTERTSDLCTQVKQYSGLQGNVVLSLKIDMGTNADRYLKRFWVKNSGTLGEAGTDGISNGGVYIYYEAASGTEVFNGNEASAQLYGDYGSNSTTNNEYGHDALNIQIPSGGLRVYVVLKNFNGSNTTDKTVAFQVLNDGLSFSPSLDTYTKARNDVFPATATTLTKTAQNSLDNCGLTTSTFADLALSIRKLSSGYSGPLIRVYNGTTYYDVYADASNKISLNSPISASVSTYNASISATTATLLSSLVSGTTNLKVAVWYDQSGNNRHVYQATDASRPKIVSSGALTTDLYGNTSLKFDYSYLQTSESSSWIAYSGYSINSVCQINGGSSRMFVGVDISANNMGLHYGDCNATTFCLNQYYNDASYTITASATPRIRTAVKYSSNGSAAWLNGVSLGTSGNPGGNLSPAFEPFNIGSGQNQNPSWYGYLTEVLVFKSELSTTVRQNLEGNQLSTYGIADATWTGGSSTDWQTASNWSPAAVPTSSQNVIIPTAGVTNQPQVSSLSIDSGKSLTLQSGTQLTVSGTLTNNGTLTIESGATLKQGTSVTGTGTYNVKQTIDNCAATNGVLSGRYWYMGSPLACTRTSVFGAESATNKVWEFTNGAYANVTNATNLAPTKGYVYRTDNSGTLTFSGTSLYAQDETLNLANNQGTYGGWNLVANPFTAYLDWHAMIDYNSSTSNINSTYYIRSYHTTGNDVNALISYNRDNQQTVSTSSYAYSGTTAQYIAPMQAFWVKVNPTATLAANAGQLRLQRSFTSHQTGSLKDAVMYPVMAKVNLYDGQRFDQLLVFMDQNISNAVDAYDSEKMFVSGVASIYTMAAGKKLVMNGMRNDKKKVSVPLYLELPTAKSYTLTLADFMMDNGVIVLEDKQEGIMQDFTINDSYTFAANSGVLNNRFVLHFFMPDATISAQGPSNSWVEDENQLNEGGSILVTSNGRGKVSVTQDVDVSENAIINIRDAAGRTVLSSGFSGENTSFELNEPSGIYFVEVQVKGHIEIQKIFVQQ